MTPTLDPVQEQALQPPMATSSYDDFEPRLPLRMSTAEFARNQYHYYRYLRERAPVHRTRIAVMNGYLISRYDDCKSLLTDPRFVRNRATATGGRRLPIPLPPSISALAMSMIIQDDPDHKRLRALVQQAFTPRALESLRSRVEQLSHELLARIEARTETEPVIDLLQDYALPIPVTVIREMMGIRDDEMPHFRKGLRMLSQGFSFKNLATAAIFDMPQVSRFIRSLIERKRREPADDILSALIQAEDDGDRLSEQELISMVWLVTIAGFETTVHLITNATVALLDHPQELARLRAEPELIGSAIEEVLRYRGPVHGTKPSYACEDVRWHGVTIPKGAIVIPVLGAANHDPEVFCHPERFDITRSPNRHLGFGYGPHFCLGAALARMEAAIAVGNLFERFENLRLAIDRSKLTVQTIPLWHRHSALPVRID